MASPDLDSNGAACANGLRLLTKRHILTLLYITASITVSSLVIMAPWLHSAFATTALGLVRPGDAAVAGTSSSTGTPSWSKPAHTDINNLDKALNGEGVYDFIYDTSHTPDDKYGIYNWCNMPHVRKQEYVKPDEEYELAYVEVIHRHHKRTPYASNSFPIEPYHWNCDEQKLYYYGEPNQGHDAARGYRQGVISPINPFVPSGWIGSCQFPQITPGGLEDSWQHGVDLYGVYHGLLGFLPSQGDDWASKVKYRVTNNIITSQVAGMVIKGMWNTTQPVPLQVQAPNIDGLEPQYSCRVGSNIFSTIKSSANPDWQRHLDEAESLFQTLDNISGVPPNDAGFHESFDHYYDNLSARQCHDKPFPCKLVDGANSTTCVTQEMADAVYRLGHWEYSQMYRDHPSSFTASYTAWGVWVAELAAHLREVVNGNGEVLYFHNVAHDGSLSRLLSILQLDEMVWPGMGAEVVFELYKKASGGLKGRGPSAPTVPDFEAVPAKAMKRDSSESSTSSYFIRVLFGGQVFKSSNPILGEIDLIPVETLLKYIDDLVGAEASLVKGKCDGSVPVDHTS